MDATALKADLKRDEGLRLKPYRDTVGKSTIGYGRNLDDLGISEAEAEQLLENDIVRVCKELDRHLFGWRLWPHCAGNALANMCFQLGWPRLSKFHDMLDALQREDFAAAAQHALDSRWAQQVPRRAERIAAMFHEASRVN